MVDADAGRFEREGHLIVRGLLDPRRDVEPLTRAYDGLIAALGAIYDAELNGPLRAPDGSASPGERLAFLLGASGGDALHHLAPVLSVFSSRFRWRRDLPPAQLPELFGLMRNEALLDAVEKLIGPEISASPIYHLNMKLAPKHLDFAERVAERSGRRSPSDTIHFGFEVGRTPWHMDAIAGLRDSHDSKIVIAWIPLTTADAERGALLLSPGSHRDGVHTELRNPYVWLAMWTRALETLTAGGMPVLNPAITSRADAEAITRRWRDAVPDVRGWLRLRAQGTGGHRARDVERGRRSRIARRLADTLRGWAGSR